MAINKFTCPKCGANIDLSEAAEKEFIISLTEQVQAKALENTSLELQDLRQQLEEQSEKLKKSRDMELDLRKEKRKLEAKEEELELELERQIDEERKKISKELQEKLTEDYQHKLTAKDLQIEGIRKELEAAKRKAEQGSQQTQGEAAELDLETALMQSFPYDSIDPVGKGVTGADLLQRVKSRDGDYCGTIIWESKNTKHWNDRWLSKLRDDQLDAKAEIAVIVSSALPEDIPSFACIDGVWVTGFPFVLGLATALRDTLLQVNLAQRSLEGKDQKIELIYRYLSGPEFKQRIEMVVSTFVEMKEDLEREKRSLNRLWNKREKELEKIVSNVSGLYGDMQGIIGAALPTIELLELPEPD